MIRKPSSRYPALRSLSGEGFGVMAVYAPELTREAVFDAIRQRRTYGTTGCRLLLDFAPYVAPSKAPAVMPARVVSQSI